MLNFFILGLKLLVVSAIAGSLIVFIVWECLND